MNTGKGDPDFDIIQKAFMLVGIKYETEEHDSYKLINLLTYNEKVALYVHIGSLVFTKEGQYIKTTY